MRLPTASRLLATTGLEWAVGASCGVAIAILVVKELPPTVTMALQVTLAATVMSLLAYAAWRRPVIAVGALIVGIPLHQLIFGRLFLWGVDVRLLAIGRYWKEAVLALLVMRTAVERRHNWTTLDRVIFGFLGLTLLYVFLPLGPPLFQRMLAARTDAAFLVVFLVARYLPGLDDSGRHLEWAALSIGVLASAVGFWNAQSPEAFLQWFQSTGIDQYRESALNLTIGTNVALTVEGGTVYRVGSFFGNALSLGHYLLIPCGLVLARAARAKMTPAHAAAGVVCAIALMLTLTRSAVVALLLMVVLALTFGSKRYRLFLIIVLVGLIAAPFLGSIPGFERLSLADAASPSSNAGHVDALVASKQHLSDNPFGTGLGTAGPAIHRFATQGIVNESWYFQIGSELGVVGMVAFIVILLMTLKALASRVRARWFAIGPFLALAGIALAGVVLHTFDDLGAAWTVWLLAGLALRPSEVVESSSSDTEKTSPRVSAPERAGTSA